MSFFIHDVTGFALATGVAAFLLIAPGFVLARALRLDDETPPAAALVLGLALLPALDALVIRWTGIQAAIMLHAVLAAMGAREAWSALRSARPVFLMIAAGWWLLVAYGNVDWDWAGRLHQPLTVLDTVKHAAVIREIALDGLPLHDPFFARASQAGYYYFFYIGPALVAYLSGGLVDSRAAFMAASFVTGVGFVATLTLVAARAKLITSARFPLVLTALCFVSGFALVPTLHRTLAGSKTLQQTEWWGENVSWLTTSTLWVPHHLSAVMAVFVAAILIARPREAGANMRCVLAVAFALAGAFGASTWIALAAAPMFAIWWVGERDRSDVAPPWVLPLAGVIALLVGLPQFTDLLVGRAPGVTPLELHLRDFGRGAELPWAMRLLLLPLGYLVDFGLFGIGTIAWLKSGGWRQACETAMGRLMIIAAITALALVSTIHSTIIGNDFGWRAILLAQVPALLWTAALVSRQAEFPNLRAIVTASVILGLATTIWSLLGLRFVRPPFFNTVMSFINETPSVDYDLRLAYEALARMAPRDAVVQHNPVLRPRAFDFGLYGSNPVAVADREAHLFGAHPATVMARIERVAPLFTETPADRNAQARAEGIDYLIFTSLDPAWPIAGPCVWRASQVCIVSTAETAR